MRANEANSEAKRHFSVRNKDVHMNERNVHSPVISDGQLLIKTAVFGLSSSLQENSII